MCSHVLPHTLAPPLVQASPAIFVTVLWFNLVGDALRDALDRRTQAGR
jgi:ABC-type dipeptide/oligopeptide/nickel transport system permease subunit